MESDDDGKWRLTRTYRNRIESSGPLSPNEIERLFYSHGKQSIKARRNKA